MTAFSIFLRRWWPLLVAALLAALLAGGVLHWLHRHDAAVRRDATLAIEVPKARRESVMVARWDTVVVHDTVRLSRWLTRYDTARATVNVHDTVEVRAFVATADSTVRSCRATVLDLLSSCQAKDTLLATQSRIIAAYREAPGIPPPATSAWRTRLLWAAAGALAGHYLR
jgi:hypothetical protein